MGLFRFASFTALIGFSDRRTPVFLLKFTFFIFSMENLSFGHSIAIFSPCGVVACLLKSNLRPSSTKNILRFFVFLRLSLVVGPLLRGSSSHFNNKKGRHKGDLLCYWSGQWDSDPRHQPWQGCALPLSYTRIICEQTI